VCDLIPSTSRHQKSINRKWGDREYFILLHTLLFFHLLTPLQHFKTFLLLCCHSYGQE
jgi:hypothetical protein